MLWQPGTLSRSSIFEKYFMTPPVDFLMGGRNFISRVYCQASPTYRLLRETSGESGYMPRNFSELKSVGGGNLYAVPPENWGMRPPVPHRSTPVQKGR